jgi:hypothetical protein
MMEIGRRRAGSPVMKTFSWLLGIVALLALAGPARPSHAQPQQNPAPAPAPAHPKHAVTVRFDYDFDLTPACPQSKDKPCVEQFIVYDISGGPSPDKRFKLFTIPVPSGAKGTVKGITGTSQPLSFQAGKHLIAVTAQMPNQKESNPSVCQFSVTIP